jgi:Cu/Ag efflux protein CusF
VFLLLGFLVGTNPVVASWFAGSTEPESSMRIAKIILMSAMAIGICMPAAVAQQTIDGIITKIDRLNGTIAIQQTQSGTVGTGTAATAVEFKVQDGSQLESVHAGDRVTFSVVESGGVKTVTSLQKQKQ